MTSIWPWLLALALGLAAMWLGYPAPLPQSPAEASTLSPFTGHWLTGSGAVGAWVTLSTTPDAPTNTPTDPAVRTVYLMGQMMPRFQGMMVLATSQGQTVGKWLRKGEAFWRLTENGQTVVEIDDTQQLDAPFLETALNLWDLTRGPGLASDRSGLEPMAPYARIEVALNQSGQLQGWTSYDPEGNPYKTVTIEGHTTFEGQTLVKRAIVHDLTRQTTSVLEIQRFVRHGLPTLFYTPQVLASMHISDEDEEATSDTP